ncbi:MAG: hypothetical protein HY827_05270 [Actinobacteria bacterium]|nr:hypothetical protein [Actinomycetota bacterium]
MGMFKSIRDLQKQSNEINKNWDPGQQMKDGMERMQEANEMMAQQTQAANMALTGTPAKASIINVVQTGAMVNFQPTMQIELNVFPDGQPPYPATVTQVVEQPFLGKAMAGQQVAVKIDPENRETVWIDWPGSMAL